MTSGKAASAVADSRTKAPELPTIDHRTPAAWRRWLKQNHAKSPGCWLLYHNKASGVIGVNYRESLEEALCWGWIDGLQQKVDADTYRRRFTPRKPRSNWSEVNKKLADELIAAGRMQPAGLAAIAAAKSSGEWAADRSRRIAPEVEPKLLSVLDADARAFWLSLAPSHKKMYLRWLGEAKLEATKQRRLAEAAQRLAQGRKLGVNQ